MPAATNPLGGRRDPRGRDVGFDLRRAAGEWLAGLRLERGLTQLDVGNALGVRDTAISAIELGRNSLPPERYRDMADALRVNRKKFIKELTRYYNPWAFQMLFPDELSEAEVDKLAERVADHRKV